MEHVMWRSNMVQNGIPFETPKIKGMIENDIHEFHFRPLNVVKEP